MQTTTTSLPATPTTTTTTTIVRSKNGLMEGAKNFLISATASGIGATAVYPVDLVKTRMQNQRKFSVSSSSSSSTASATLLYRNSLDCFQKTLAREGFFGLYKGLLPNLVGQVPEKAIRLWVVATVRNLVFDKTVEDLEKVQLKAEILAGTAAGACQVIITNPAEIVKVRLQVAGEVKHTSASGAPKPLGFASILQQLGFRGIYKGASACFLRDIPFSALYFPIYAKMKEFHKERGDGELSAFDLFLSGSIAGVFAASLTTPADVIKTRLQVEPRPGEAPYAGLRDCLWRVLRTEGVG
jgi:solute carrier family 25 aspartate/glutamate transporter 12/13